MTSCHDNNSLIRIWYSTQTEIKSSTGPVLLTSKSSSSTINNWESLCAALGNLAMIRRSTHPFSLLCSKRKTPPKQKTTHEPKKKKQKTTNEPVATTPKVRLHNLSHFTRARHILEFFKLCGRIVGLKLLHQPRASLFLRQADVEFDSVASAQKALKMDGQKLLQHEVDVSAPPSDKLNTQNKCVRISGYNPGKWNHDELQVILKDYFLRCGAVKDVKILKSGRKATITFEYVYSISKARHLRHPILEGKELSIF